MGGSERKKKQKDWRKCLKCGIQRNCSVSFFKFPTDVALRDRWAEFCDVNVGHLKSHHRICSQHFPVSCFKARNRGAKGDGSSGKSYLKDKAVPSIVDGFNRLADYRDSSNYVIAGTEKSANLKGCCVICGPVDRNAHRFRFPKDPKEMISWLNACGLQQDDLSKDARICELHFEPDDMEVLPNRVMLKKGVKPSLTPQSRTVVVPVTPDEALQIEFVDCSSFALSSNVFEESSDADGGVNEVSGPETFRNTSTFLAQSDPLNDGEDGDITEEILPWCPDEIGDSATTTTERIPLSIEDISTSHCGTSRCAKMILDVARNDILRCRNINAQLRAENSRLKNKVKILADAFNELRSRNLLSDEALASIKVRI